MKCPECGFTLRGDERVCPRCLLPVGAKGRSGAPAASPSPVPEAAGRAAPAIDMTEQMQRLMRGPLWSTRRLQLALSAFLLIVAAVVLALALWSVLRQDAAY
jgi:hypothetical protein